MIVDPLLEALGDEQAVTQPVMLEPREVPGAHQIVAVRARTAAVLVKAYPQPDLHEILKGFRQILGDIALQSAETCKCLDPGEAVGLCDATLKGERPHAVHNGKDTALLHVDLACMLAMAEQDLVKVAASIVPLSRTMKEQISHIRNWAFERAVRASPRRG